MTAVTLVQARVQGDAPVWNKDAKMWLSEFGDTTELAYMNNLDTVNTASVEGTLTFVRAEGINVNEQSVLGDLNIDDLVGITEMATPVTKSSARTAVRNSRLQTLAVALKWRSRSSSGRRLAIKTPMRSERRRWWRCTTSWPAATRART
uniref:Uncharacterized protein n=1 Tax=Hyaloperonospora arabidopsidis (strain Emoy2) TaxID=559515 RepID=M4BY29_HYAAE